MKKLTRLFNRDNADKGESPDALIAKEVKDAFCALSELFPGISTEFALPLLEQNNNDVEEVFEILADLNGGYPRESTTGNQPSSSTGRQRGQDVARNELSSPAYDFSSRGSFIPSFHYRLQSLGKLLYDFPFLDHRIARVLFKENSCHYSIAFSAICKAILDKGDTPADPRHGRKLDELLLLVLSGNKALKAEETALLRSLFNIKIPTKSSISLYLRRGKGCPRITCPILAEEIEYVHAKAEELRATLESRIAKRKRMEVATRNGTTVTCSCCFDEFPIEDMVACRNEGHLFCEECLCKYVNSQTFGKGCLGVARDNEVATEITCCQGDCSSGFSAWALQKALKDDKVLRAYDTMQYKVIIDKAGLSENMYTCPECQLLFELPGMDMPLFVCPNCNIEACTKCHEPPHTGPCDAEKAVEARGRHRVEEAATMALVRKCPGCHTAVLKDGGCNKMSCGCGVKFCYCCLKKIRSYRHFCQKPHCLHESPKACNYKCVLYTDDKDLELQDREKVRNAALAEAATLQEVKVDVENVLMMPPQREYFV